MASKLLFVEPDSYDRDLFRKVFSDRHILQFAETIQALSFQVQAFCPHVVIVDIPVPDIPDLIRIFEIHKGQPFRTPVILIVSENQFESEKFARIHGVFYYMIKPFTFRDLEEAITSAIHFYHKQQT